MSRENSFLIVSCFRNAEDFIFDSAVSVLRQRYPRFRAVFTDDFSKDSTTVRLRQAVQDCNGVSRCETTIKENSDRRGMMLNTHLAIVQHARPGDIVVIVDGDDRLIHDDVLTYIDAFFEKHDCWVMYGGAHWNPPGTQTFHSQSYSNEEIENLRVSPDADFAQLFMRWRIHHIRAFRAELYLEMVRRDPGANLLRRFDGEFFPMAADAAVMRPLLELAGGDRVRLNKVNLYEYNIHPSNDHHLDRELQWDCVREIFAKPALTRLDQLPENFPLSSQTNASDTNRHSSSSPSDAGRTESSERPMLFDEVKLNSCRDFFSMEVGPEGGLLSCRVKTERSSRFSSGEVDFLVWANDELVGYSPKMVPGERPRTLVATIPPNVSVKIEARSTQVVTFDARVEHLRLTQNQRTFRFPDPLGRAELRFASSTPVVENCVATLANPKHAGLLETLLKTLVSCGNVGDAQLVVIAVGDDGTIEEIAGRYSALVVHADLIFAADATLKSLLYSIAHVVRAQRYVCLDADMVIRDSLSPLWGAIDSMPIGASFVARECNRDRYSGIQQAFVDVYRSRQDDFDSLQHHGGPFKETRHVVNDGLIAGGRHAFLAVDSYLREFDALQRWVFENPEVTWRNQFAFNLALSRFGSGVILSDRYNFQLEHFDGAIESLETTERDGESLAVLHFNGNARKYHPALMDAQSDESRDSESRDASDFSESMV